MSTNRFHPAPTQQRPRYAVAASITLLSLILASIYIAPRFFPRYLSYQNRSETLLVVDRWTGRIDTCSQHSGVYQCWHLISEPLADEPEEGK